MKPLLLLALLVSGIASRYDPGVFDAVVATRQAYGQLPARIDATRYIALADCGRVGDSVMVCHEGECWRALVADCAGVADGGLAWMLRNGIAGEVDYDTAMEYGCVGKQIDVYALSYAGRRFE